MLKSLNHLELVFCMVRDENLVSFSYKQLSAFPVPFVEDAVLSPMCIFGIYIYNQHVICSPMSLYLGLLFNFIDLLICFCASTEPFLLLYYRVENSNNPSIMLFLLARVFCASISILFCDFQDAFLFCIFSVLTVI